MSPFAFRCFNNTVGGLCVVNGQCLDNRCQCPPNFGPDNIFFHFPNCSLPNYLFLAFFVEYTILCVILTFFLYRYANPRQKKNFDLIVWTFLSLLSTWSSVLAIYLQDGSFELVFQFGIFCSVALVLVAKLILNVLEPLFDIRYLDKTKMIKTTWITVYVFAFLILSLGLALSCLSRRTDDSLYNIVAYIFLIVFLIGGCSFLGILFYYSTHLLKQLKITLKTSIIPLDTKSSIVRLRKKIHSIRVGCAILFLIIFIWFGEVAIIPIFGSFPFHYVFFMSCLHALLILCAGILFSIKPRESSASFSSAPTVQDLIE